MVDIVAQAFGIVGMLFNIFSYQCKSNRKLLICLGISGALFSVNYILIGAIASAGFNIINILRTMSITNKKSHNNIFFAGICALYLIVTAITYENVWTIILLLSQFAATFAMWYKDGAFIRKVQLLFVSPIWFINNTFISFTIGGIICELFAIISIIVSVIRFGFDGFEE